MIWLLKQRYKAMLLALLLMIVIYPALQTHLGTRLIFDVCRTVLFSIAFAIIWRDRSLRIAGLVLGTPAIVGVWMNLTHDTEPPAPVQAAYFLVIALFLSTTIVAILRGVYQRETVTLDSIYAAFCSYLLIGIVFANLYALLEVVTPGSFSMTESLQGKFESLVGSHYLLVYFSMITLTTVGFGDITPANEASRGLALMEAVLGQFYIAVLVAELIGRRVAQAFVDRESESSERD